MLNQTFNPKSLYNIATIDDVKKYNLGKNKLEVMSSITSISYDVSQSDFKFTNIKKTKINNKGVYIINDRNEYFAIKS
ncbi:hypothetical protein CRG86_014765 [Photobacterium leiognathi]|nr:hypothetical protein CRG86_014765 [Photobacterium leiognathi]